MEPVADETGAPEAAASTTFQQQPTGPIRILVQTKTHLVPGDKYAERIDRMRNLICQHHWNRDFDWNQDRWNLYGADFGFDDRNCYFLVDHGESPTDPPILWYSWTGESFVAIQEPLPPSIRTRLRRYPFTRQEKSPKQRKKASQREIIQAVLECNMEILQQDLDFLMQHPEDARWLKKNVDPRHWLKIASLCNFVKEE